MKDKPLVTAIIGTHNRAHCLPRALDSIYSQEGLGHLFDLEVIVVDDGSTDSTPQIIQRYPGLKYIRQSESRGISATLNEGLRASQGNYIAFLDDDDEWLAHKLRVQLPLLEARHEVGVIYSQSLMRIGEEQRLIPDDQSWVAPSGRVFLAMLMDNFCGHRGSLLVRRSAFDSAGYFDENLLSYEDWDMCLRLAFQTDFLFCPGPVDIYNLSPKGLWLSRIASGAGVRDAERVIEKNLLLLPESADSTKLKRKALARFALEASSMAADPVQAWTNALTTLRQFPEVVDEGWAKFWTETVLARLLRSEQSLWALHRICSQFQAVAQSLGTPVIQWTRYAIPHTLTDIARSPQTSNRHALRVATCALICAPFCSLPYKALVRVAVRALLGRSTELACTDAYKRTKRARASAAGASAAR